MQLFDDAEALFAKDRVGEACPKYAESYRLDPQLGVLVYLAECYEKNGQVASAWGTFREAEEIARKRSDARAGHARERAAALEQKLSYIVIQVPDSVRVSKLQVLRDGLPVSSVLWGVRAAIDPGPHHIEVSAPGYQTWQRDVVVAIEPGSSTVDVPQLSVDPASTAQGSSSSTKSGVGSSAPGTSRRIAALAVGGLGVIGVGVGGFFGLSAQTSLSDSNALCNSKNFCTPAGNDLRDGAKSKALVATISTGVGAAALATAAVLWFTAPPADDSGAASLPSRRSAWVVLPAASGWGMEIHRDF